jgi:hypothetical protein
MLIAKSAREVHKEVVVFFPPLAFVVTIPLGVLVTLIMVSPNRLVFWGVISPWSQVSIVLVFSFILGIIRLMDWICHIQLFKIMNFLNGRGLNKVNVSMWFSMWRRNWLWRTKKWEINIVLWQRFIGRIGRKSPFTSAQVMC